MTKSFRVQLEDGSEAEAYDGAMLVKSLQDQMQSIRTETNEALGQVTQALTRSTQLIKALREQNAALSEQAAALAKGGRGRKSQINVHERRMAGEELAKAEGFKPAEIMAKALSAQRDGRLTGTEVAEIDAYLARDHYRRRNACHVGATCYVSRIRCGVT